MDRRKSEARSHLKKLEEECNITVELLNKLLTVCSSHVDVLENLDSKDFRLHSKYFLAITEFQYHTLQKLLEVNIELEEHIVEQKPVIANTVLSTSSFSNVSRDFLSPISTISISNSHASPDEDNVLTTPPPRDLISPVSSDGNGTVGTTLRDCDTPVVNPTCGDVKVEDATSSSTSSELYSLENVDDSYGDMENNCSPEFDNVSMVDLTKSCEINNIAPIGVSSPTKAESVASSEYFCCVSLNDTKSDDLNFDEPFTEDAPYSTNIVDVLRALPKMTVEEKLSVVPMKTIALQPSTVKMSTLIKHTGIKRDEPVVNFNSLSHHSQDKFDEVDDDDDFIIEEREDPVVDDYCMISYIESPSHFYIQVADHHIEQLDLFSEQIASFACKKISYSSKMNAKEVLLGDFACVNNDGYWYRVEILNWFLDKNITSSEVQIQFVDYGRKCLISYKELQPLLKELCHIPKMAQLCHLDSIYPPGSYSKNICKQWPELSIDGFKEACGDLENSVFLLTHVLKEGKSFAIDLAHDTDTSNGSSVGEVFLGAGLGVEILYDNTIKNRSMIDQIRRCHHGLQNVHPDMSRDDILEMYFARSNEEEVTNINEAVMHYNPRDEALTCRNLRRDGTCYKGSRCRFRHVPLKSGFTRDKEEVYNRAFAETPLPAVNDEVLLTISHIVDVQCFYAQIQHNDGHDFDNQTIFNLTQTMNNPDTVKLYQKFKYPPGVSQLVIVKHWNKFWFRGMVLSIEIPENNDKIMVEIFVVDFGDELVVPLSDLRVIHKDFLFMPFQAVQCRLYNIRHRRGGDADEEKTHLEKHYLGQKFIGKIIAVSGHLEVLLYTRNRREDVGETLIAAGYGELNTEHNFPRDSDVFLID